MCQLTGCACVLCSEIWVRCCPRCPQIGARDHYFMLRLGEGASDPHQPHLHIFTRSKPGCQINGKNNLGSSGCHQPNCNLSTYNLLVASYCYMTWIILGSPFCSSIDCSCPESPQTPQVVITIILWNMIRGNPSLIMPGLLCILINVGIKLITKKNTHYNTLTGYKYRK